MYSGNYRKFGLSIFPWESFTELLLKPKARFTIMFMCVESGEQLLPQIKFYLEFRQCPQQLHTMTSFIFQLISSICCLLFAFLMRISFNYPSLQWTQATRKFGKQFGNNSQRTNKNNSKNLLSMCAEMSLFILHCIKYSGLCTFLVLFFHSKCNSTVTTTI